MSRIQVLDFPVMHPGKCALCGSQGNRDGRKYIDFGAQVDRYGAVIFCSECLSEICGYIGWANPEKVYGLETALKAALLEIEVLKEENVSLRAALGNLDFLRTIGSTAPESSEADSFEGRTESSDVDDAEGIKAGKQGNAKSSDVGGLADILGTTSTDNSPGIAI